MRRLGHRLRPLQRNVSTWTIAIALVSGAVGCARHYVPKEPKTAKSEAANVIVESLQVNTALTFEVRLRVAARPGAELWDARFALEHDRPCSAGTVFREIQADGEVISEGPLAIGGVHDLVLTFSQNNEDRRWSKSSSEPAFIDLSVEDPVSGRACTRIALMGAPSAPTFRLERDGVGISVHIGGRAYPHGIASQSETRPSGAFLLRLGLPVDRFRGWVEIGAIFTGIEQSRYLLFAPGIDRSFWESGPWALRAGLAYDVAFNFYRPDLNQTATSRYTLHGPRATLGFSYGLIRNLLMPGFSTHSSLPAGQRTLSLEFEVPVSLWFGAGDAPRTMLVTGVGAGIFWAF